MIKQILHSWYMFPKRFHLVHLMVFFSLPSLIVFIPFSILLILAIIDDYAKGLPMFDDDFLFTIGFMETIITYNLILESIFVVGLSLIIVIIKKLLKKSIFVESKFLLKNKFYDFIFKLFLIEILFFIIRGISFYK